MIVTIGSQNPVKIAAARRVLSQAFPDATVDNAQVYSGVPPQPWGDLQTRQGAVNRARAALSAKGALGIGFEGGLVETEFGIMTCAWCAVVDPVGHIGLGGGVYMLLPPAVINALEDGLELGHAMDAVTGLHNSKQDMGAVGILTNGLSSRQRAYEQILIQALTPFLRSDLYHV